MKNQNINDYYNYIAINIIDEEHCYGASASIEHCLKKFSQNKQQNWYKFFTSFLNKIISIILNNKLQFITTNSSLFFRHFLSFNPRSFSYLVKKFL